MNRTLTARVLFPILAVAVAPFISGPAMAYDANGNPVCTAPGDQRGAAIVSDGAGGTIVAWHDLRPTVAAGGVTFAQRVNAAGVPQWTLNGVQLSTTGDPGDTGDPAPPAIASDGAGGAFLAYGGISASPRAQWVNAAGIPQWGADGVQLTNLASTKRDVAIIRDIGGAGGVIVVWRYDNGSGGNPDIYAQKVNAAGAIQWGLGGVAVTSTSMNTESLPNLISDGLGGAIIVHMGSNGCRAQRVNSAGVNQWGNTILNSLSNNRRPAIVTDGSGGAVVGWGAGSTGIFVNRMNSAGDRLWNPSNSGIQLCTTGNQCALIPDGAGGATVVWQESPGTNYNIFAQRVDGNGAIQWTANGVPVAVVQDDQLAPTIVSDGGMGSILTWYDRRSGASGDDIYAQHLNSSGAPQWNPDGNATCTAPLDQLEPASAVDGAGGAFVAWEDRRTGAGADIYMHHLHSSGQILDVPGDHLSPSMARAWPNPFLDRVRVAFVLPTAAAVRLEVFDVHGRSMRAYEPGLLPAGEQALAWDGRSSDGRKAGPGIYYLRVMGPGVAFSQRVVRLE